MNLFESLVEKTKQWRENNYHSDEFPAISEILLYNKEDGKLRFLREPQFRALEVYWYLRIVQKTPDFLTLYKTLFPRKSDFRKALSIHTNQEITDMIENEEDYLEKIKTDDEFVKRNKLESLKESLDLDYPSYILALAMGAGKTILIGTIIATEFAMSIEYPDANFMKNALVFAPGTTIIEALKEIADIPFNKILPSRLYRPFMANIKLTYTKSGEKDIPVEQGGSFNLIVTNTEKIMLRKIRKNANQTSLEFEEKEKQEQLYSNLRLQKISSLPNLGIFSDEAHHTYGQKLGEELKRVRSTINYLHEKKEIICVVNTTGTPYYKSQTLKDVVFWYGIAEGIQDNILKSLENGIRSYSISRDNNSIKEMIADIIQHFWDKYGGIKTVDGCKSKIAFYFPTEEALKDARPFIDTSLVQVGQPSTIVLKNTQTSSKQEIDDFNALNDPNSLYRVMLLVGKGTEGWNCPSLFATALIRKISGANNFLLQASTRCLRQIANNKLNATIYLDGQNVQTLDNELKETYGSSLVELNAKKADMVTQRLFITKAEMPKLLIKKIIEKVVLVENKKVNVILSLPDETNEELISINTYNPNTVSDGKVLYQTAEGSKTLEVDSAIDVYAASILIAENYYLDSFEILKKLKNLYSEEIPTSHLIKLFDQVESQVCNYKITTEEVEEALAIIRLNNIDGNSNFQIDDKGRLFTEIRYTKGNDINFLSKEKTENNNGNFGFHYTPYNFDSNPEKDFYINLLNMINEKPEDVEDIYFTGALTDPNKTDFYFEYKGKDEQYHNYFPDFIIRKKSKGKKDGKFYIVEIKAESERDDAIDGENGMKKLKLTELENLNKNRFKYEIVFVPGSTVPSDKYKNIKEFLNKE
ncbi:MAG: DEAD/DEAH box helicase family protein [Ignavibacteriae bacterium]|nr:DEAD/DEAH box helicase family protein [Ignavibacteriota bacterium]